MICENCIHKEVCGLEGYYDEALKFCAFKTEFIPMKSIDEIKAEFIKQYPKNYAGDLELGGSSCVFSLDKVLKIIDEKVAERI